VRIAPIADLDVTDGPVERAGVRNESIDRN
jgi:hypothetical protein